jgi:hypothetical protein
MALSGPITSTHDEVSSVGCETRSGPLVFTLTLLCHLFYVQHFLLRSIDSHD